VLNFGRLIPGERLLFGNAGLNFPLRYAFNIRLYLPVAEIHNSSERFIPDQ